jgi:uncharacterized RDD family membrane protein YckC
MSNHHKSQLWKHLAALLYDIFPILAIWLVTSLFLLVVRGGSEIEPGTPWLTALLVAEVWLYFTYSWKMGGQTLGMRAWKIQISDFQELSWAQVSLRFITGVISTLLLGLGLWTRMWSAQQQSWMDLVCGKPVIDVSSDQS